MKVLLFLTIFFLPYAFGMDLEELSFASFLKRQALCKRDVKVGDSDALIRETIDALCLNQDQAVTYLKERLMRREERLFKDTISQLVKRNRQFAVDVVLGIFASYIEDREYEEYLAVTGRNGQLSMLYYSLSSLFPKLNEYYTSTGRYCLLTIRGVERVIGLLNEKKNYFKDVPCAICSDLDELTESIKTKAAEELNQDELRRYVFLSKCSSLSKNNFTDHVSACFLQQSKDGLKLLILDSTGEKSKQLNESEANYINDLKESVKAALQEGLNVKSTVYVHEGLKRQYDWTGCTIFAISDAIEYSRHTDIFDWVERQGKARAKEVIGSADFISFVCLPPYMMKMTQSAKKIETYLKERFDLTANKQDGVQRLPDILAKHEMIDIAGLKVTRVNTKSGKRFLKYMRLLFKDVILNESLPSS